ncbi:MAG: MlaD family protein [Spirochaetes bacterium]|jgi:ABC-type transporter Mla subunit MlaD|nr:MlaD family protein [Spirochaetota bacterium]
MKLDKNEYRVALFILVPIVVILLFIILKLGYSLASSTIDIYLKVDSITSIKKGTQVKVKGYNIGRIIEIKPVYHPELHFLAVMRVQRDIEIFEECYAQIMNQNIIGEPVVDIINPEVKTDLIKEGSVIEGSEMVNLEAVLTNVQALLSNLNKTVDILRGMTNESRSNIRQLIANLTASVASVNKILVDSQSDIGVILASFRETAKTMNEISIELKKRPMGFLMKGKDEENK